MTPNAFAFINDVTVITRLPKNVQLRYTQHAQDGLSLIVILDFGLFTWF